MARPAGSKVGVQAIVRVGEATEVVVGGLADVTTNRAVTAEDRFAIASITKPMVATAVLQYVNRKRIRLDDPVDAYLPSLLPSKKITIRQLLSHRAGLAELAETEIPSGSSARQLVEISAKHPLDFSPGSDGSYSNIGYLTLGLLLEQLSGRPLPEVLQAAVFQPAGMSSTTMGGEPTVLGYDQGKVVDSGVDDANWFAAGGVVSTASDVDRFYRHLLAGDLLPLQSVHEMSMPTGTVPFGTGDYGLGLWIWPQMCGDGVGHSGWLPGFSSKAFTLPDKDRSVVVLLNKRDEDDGLSAALAASALCA
jgi:D-alanyl-D-alanine carboxypeptidase